MNSQNTFASQLLSYQKAYDIEPLFSDLLDLCLCVLSPSALAGFPLNRDCFESILLKYADPALPLDFTPLFALLLKEMRCQMNPYGRNAYSDILGDFYEEHILGYDPENPFTGWDIHEAKLRPDIIRIEGATPVHKRTLFDPACASGRRLLSFRWMHTVDTFYGADITPACVKMSILNLFLHHVPNAEVICIKITDIGNSFVTGYGFNSLSPGIREIGKEDSKVWQLMQEKVPMALAA